MFPVYDDGHHTTDLGDPPVQLVMPGLGPGIHRFSKKDGLPGQARQ
jgi:hypothetical protein